MKIRPIALREAREFISKHHRHNIAPRGWLFGCSLWDGSAMVGVGVASRPLSRELQDGTTAEIVRVCTDGTKDACSMLYGALRRALKALGYRRIYTYTLVEESGSSLRAAGFRVDEPMLAPRPSWAGANRPRYEADLFGMKRQPQGSKVRWVWP